MLILPKLDHQAHQQYYVGKHVGDDHWPLTPNDAGPDPKCVADEIEKDVPRVPPVARS